MSRPSTRSRQRGRQRGAVNEEALNEEPSTSRPPTGSHQRIGRQRGAVNEQAELQGPIPAIPRLLQTAEFLLQKRAFGNEKSIRKGDPP